MNKSVYIPIFLTTLMVSALFLLQGCATSHGEKAKPGSFNVILPATPDLLLHKNASWWGARFKIAWPEGQPFDMAVDVMLAHQVIMPVLEEYGPGMPLWRFHRRAARDATGHQFSFLFYADPDLAEVVFEKIGKSDVLLSAISEQMVERYKTSDTTVVLPGGVSGMSDPAWSVEMQRQWPYFIMGCSATWLGLVDEMSDKLMKKDNNYPDNTGELLAHYRNVQAAVSDTWYKESQHSFFHHLSAVFGYRPMLMQKRLVW